MPYIPKIGGENTVSFPLQFPDSTVSKFSMGTTLVEQLANDGSGTTISHSSGFLWRHNDSAFLISARHVFSGTSPFDDTPLSDSGFVPRLLRIHQAEGVSGALGRGSATIELADPNGRRRWFQDPHFETLRTDIAALELDGAPKDIICLNDEPGFDTAGESLFCHIGFQCFVLGFPNSNIAGLKTPVWRSGSIASEPALPVDGKPMFLIDAATGPGFSGGPVFRMHVGPAPFHDASTPSGIRMEQNSVLKSKFIGVYAGRLAHRHYGGEVPFVFYANRIPLILASKA